MIRVSVMYPSGDGKRFDHDYYVSKHMSLVRARLGGLGLRRLEVDRGLAGGAPGAPAPFACLGHLYFDSVADFQAAMKPHGKEILADVPNFTDITPQVQISEIVSA
ncbi:MAG TPA: EthD family reductase [Methylomirabilota bacterium]|nr:EthD family reductase [Methylomirabilota bacterium]